MFEFPPRAPALVWSLGGVSVPGIGDGSDGSWGEWKTLPRVQGTEEDSSDGEVMYM